jgi:hypothetical protein
LSIAKNLLRLHVRFAFRAQKILRYAQDDKSIERVWCGAELTHPTALRWSTLSTLGKEGVSKEKNIFILPQPSFRLAGERVVERSDDRVSQLCMAPAALPYFRKILSLAII